MCLKRCVTRVYAVVEDVLDDSFIAITREAMYAVREKIVHEVGRIVSSVRVKWDNSPDAFL